MEKTFSKIQNTNEVLRVAREETEGGRNTVRYHRFRPRRTMVGAGTVPGSRAGSHFGGFCYLIQNSGRLKLITTAEDLTPQGDQCQLLPNKSAASRSSTFNIIDVAVPDLYRVQDCHANSRKNG